MRLQKLRLEKYLHFKVKQSREKFLNNHKKLNSKFVFLDVPLLFEKKLTNMCDYIVLLTAPEEVRMRRALNRKGMNKTVLEKIIKSQIKDNIKKKKSDFIINTTYKKNLLSKKIFGVPTPTENRFEKVT